MCALRGKGQARARQRILNPHAPKMGPINLLKTNYFLSCIQRPGEKCGLEVDSSKKITFKAKNPGSVSV